MKKYFVISDTHSCYTVTRDSLIKAGFDLKNPEHIVIHCGDMMDRGEESKAVLDFFWNLHEQNRLIFIRGNHEDLFDDMIRYRNDFSTHRSNGTMETMFDLCGEDFDKKFNYANFQIALAQYDKRWDALRAAAIDFYETPHYIFTHGYIPCFNEREGSFHYKPEWRTATSVHDWKEARWLCGFDAFEAGIYVSGKTIVFGHWTVGYGRAKSPNRSYRMYLSLKVPQGCTEKQWFGTYAAHLDDGGIIALDGTINISEVCNVLVIDEKDM